LFKKAIYKTRYKYFRSGIIYVQNWRVFELLKCILAMQKQLTNRPQVMTNQTDHRWRFVTLVVTWKTFKYLNINDSLTSVLNINYVRSEILVSCLVYCFFKQIVDIFFYKAYYQESNILIIVHSSMVTVAEWLDGSFESQNRLWKAQRLICDTKDQK
jgi:hypothetical protein